MFNGRLFHRRRPLYFIDVRPTSFVHRGIVKRLRSLSRLLSWVKWDLSTSGHLP